MVAELEEPIHEVPPLPASARRVMVLCAAPDSTIREIGDTVADDTKLASEIMRIANSAMYKRSRDVT